MYKGSVAFSAGCGSGVLLLLLLLSFHRNDEGSREAIFSKENIAYASHRPSNSPRVALLHRR